MFRVLTYAIKLHHQVSLQGSDQADDKHGVVHRFYGILSYYGLAQKRTFMAFNGINVTFVAANLKNGFPTRQNANVQ